MAEERRMETEPPTTEAPKAEPAPAASAPRPAPAPDYYDQLLRLKAEFENYRRRMDRERPDWINLGKAGVLDRLLPLYDLLVQAHEQVRKASGGVPKDLSTGLDLVFKEFARFFDAEGVKAIEAAGKPYHHDLHEVLGSVETDERPEGTVLEELQRGYTLNGKVLRPAKVRVAKPKAKDVH